MVLAASAAHTFFFWGGWSALVAIGTLGLAGATVWLGFQAKKEVSDAWAREWAAQRPEVYPLLTLDWTSMRRETPYFTRRGQLLPLKNGGRGPALNLRGKLRGVYGGQEYTYEIIAGTIAPDELLDARIIPPVRGWPDIEGEIEYEDLVGGKYKGRFSLSVVEGTSELVVTTLPTEHLTRAASVSGGNRN